MTVTPADLVPHLPRLWRYALALTRSRPDADDLVNDTALRALIKAHLFVPGTDLRAWLFTMMHHQHVNNVRTAARRQRDLTLAPPGALAPTPADDPAVRLHVADAVAAMRRLPSEQRRAILLVGYHGLTYEAAAAVERVPVGTIRSRLSRGRADLFALVAGAELSADDLDLLAWARR